MHSAQAEDFAPNPLIDMAQASEVTMAFSSRTKPCRNEVFAADGSVLFDDPYITSSTTSHMAFTARDSFSQADTIEPQPKPVETTFKEPDLKRMSLQELQELHRRISQVHASLTQESSIIADKQRMERG
ncbi:MAG: hypothetical protein JSS83_18920 [Cyanobacteria bacterium SZAS LIN-3]|nr:hypothetical protein [Cyanobacteria bacterium SZAS LIN-3]MBS2005980.1 hypothetical protein [Cyanobacteria bacterium SZAS TMP-1]